MERFIVKDGEEVKVSSFIRKAVVENRISFDVVYLKNGLRLDYYANEYYQDPTLWWVIAAASGIGWWLQVPDGTKLYIPNMSEVESLTSRI